MKKELLFTVNKKDFLVQTFRSGGKGGQHQNKTNSGVRIIHDKSGARGECRNHREQLSNKKEAFRRLVDSPKFQLWIKRTSYELITNKTINERVEAEIAPDKVKIEFYEDGEWRVINER